MWVTLSNNSDPYMLCAGWEVCTIKKTVPDLGLENAVQERGHTFFFFTIRTDP